VPASAHSSDGCVPCESNTPQLGFVHVCQGVASESGGVQHHTATTSAHTSAGHVYATEQLAVISSQSEQGFSAHSPWQIRLCFCTGKHGLSHPPNRHAATCRPALALGHACLESITCNWSALASYIVTTSGIASEACISCNLLLCRCLAYVLLCLAAHHHDGTVSLTPHRKAHQLRMAMQLLCVAAMPRHAMSYEIDQWDESR
jgi:hypothetical protein